MMRQPILSVQYTLVTVFACIFCTALQLAAADEEGAQVIADLPNKEIFVHSITPLLDSGQSVDWSWRTDKIVVDKPGVNRYYNVYALSADGYKQRSLTLGMAGGERHHSGGPAWYPTGEYAVFVSQNVGSGSYRMSLPQTGLNCNLWFTDKEGTKYWQLTRTKTTFSNPEGTVYPTFSPDGTRLAWSGNTGRYPPESLWGERAIYVAEFFLMKDKPELRDIKKLQPGDRKDFYETHGFSPDGRLLLFCANPEKDQAVTGMDICLMNVNTGKMMNLTKSPDEWDEFAAYSPNGEKIVWGSSRGQDMQYAGMGAAKWQSYLKSELWIMDKDGDHPRQLTDFNNSTNPDYGGRRCFVGDVAWNGKGDKLVVCLNYESRNFSIESRILVVTLGRGAPPTPVDEAPARPEEEGTAVGRPAPGPAPSRDGRSGGQLRY